MNMKTITKQFREVPTTITKKYDELFNEDSINQFNEAYYTFSDVVNAMISRYSTFRADYAKEFDDKSNEESVIGKIYRSYLDNIEENKGVYDAMKEYAYYSQEDINYLSNREKELNDEIFYFGDVLHHIFCKYSMNFALIKSSSQDNLNLIYNTILTFYIILSASIIILFSLNLWLGVKKLKYAIHVLLNLLFLLLFIGCLTAGFAGMISKISSNLPPLLDKWTSIEYLGIGESDLGGTANSAVYLDTCVSGNGALSIPLGVIDDKVARVNQYVNIAERLAKVQNNTNDIEKVSLMIEEVKNIKEDDVYELSMNKTVKEMKNKINSNSIDCSTTSSSLYQNYCAFISDVHNDIQTLHSNIDEINSQYRAMKTILSDMIDKANLINQKIIKEYQSLRGNNDNILHLFDCSFMKPDLLAFSFLLGEKFSGINTSICLCCFIGAFFAYIGIYFLVYTMYHFQQSANEETLVSIKYVL